MNDMHNVAILIPEQADELQSCVNWPALVNVNPLMGAALPLLLLLQQLANIDATVQPIVLRNKVIQQLAVFEAQANKAGYTTRIIIAARYCICTAIDEFVLCTAWGAQSIWAKQSLLSLIQHETWGGERFFIILEKLLTTAEQHIDLLELLYFILYLGFEGKYYQQGKTALAEIRHRLLKTIQQHKPAPLVFLNNSERSSLSRHREKTWRIPMLFGLMLISLWTYFNLKTYVLSKPILHHYQNIIAELAESA